MIDGTAKRAIDKFISTDPKFEDICNELQVYNRYVEQTQEITSLEYFTFIRLDCEKVRRGLGDAARDLANSLLQNVVDTYRKENESICAAFEEIERIALNAPKSTKEMIELGEYMLHVKNKRMLQLNVRSISLLIQLYFSSPSVRDGRILLNVEVSEAEIILEWLEIVSKIAVKLDSHTKVKNVEINGAETDSNSNKIYALEKIY